MAFDLSQLDGEHRRWVAIGLGDMEVHVEHVGPKDQERFRRQLIREGVLKDGQGVEFKEGKFDAFCLAYAKRYVKGWRNVILDGVENPEYSADAMAKILAQASSPLEKIGASLREESDFFSSNGNGSTP